MKTKNLLLLLLMCTLASGLKAAIHTINAGSYYFSPSSHTINVGDTVEWINDGGFHDVNADISTLTGSSFNNPISFQSSATGITGALIYTHIFTVAGTYNYDCSIGSHAANGMVGSIIVNSSNSIYDIVSNSTDHTTLKTAIDACGLDVLLSDPGSLTLFAPTDAAFSLLPAGTVTSLLANIPQLTSILQHHVVQGSVMSGMLSNNQLVTTLNGTDVTVTINVNGVFIDNAQVTLADIVADNGVVHVIDAVLLPTQSNTVYGIVSNSPDHTTLKTAIDACALDGYLSAAGPFTLFAPTDAAFNLLPAGTVTSLLANIPQLTNILKHHVVADSLMSGMLSNNQIVTTLLGTDITVTINANGVFIDNAQVILVDLVADNGVVHVIDAVLLPPAPDCDGIFNGIAALDSCGTCHKSYVYAGMGVLNYIDTYADTLNFQGTFILAGSAMDQQFNPNWANDPNSCSNSIYDIVSNSADHTTLKTAIDACGLDVVLSDPGSLTLFAPTDAAFNLLPAGTVTSLLANIPQLTDILKHHVVNSSVMSSMLSNNQIVTTLNGDVLVTINSMDVFIDNAQVTGPDISADNGVVHVIDAVLLPTATEVTDINLTSLSEYLYSVNILGEKINRFVKNQVIFDIYNNGEVVKRFVR